MLWQRSAPSVTARRRRSGSERGFLLKWTTVIAVMCGGAGLAVATPRPSTDTKCTPTLPNHHAPPQNNEEMPPGAARFWYGNSVVGTSLWPDGVVAFKAGGPGSVLRDGALRMKFYWLKRPDVRLSITG